MRSTKVTVLSLLLAATPLVAKAAAVHPDPKLAVAIASPSRNADNVKLDESRKPAELLQYLGVRKGMNVLDLAGGNGYWAEIIAPVVGPRGKVTVWAGSQFYTPEIKKSFESFMARQPNVSIVASPFEAPKLPKNYADFVMFNLDYHDTYWQSAKYGVPRMDPSLFLKAVYAAMKPGATIGVIDHVADPNSDTRATVEKLHRIDPEVVKADFKRAGFVLVGSSDLLRNPADDHSLLVYDPRVRGKTDRFIFKFKKPS